MNTRIKILILFLIIALVSSVYYFINRPDPDVAAMGEVGTMELTLSLVSMVLSSIASVVTIYSIAVSRKNN